MRVLSIVLLSCAFATTAIANRTSYDGFKVYSVQLNSAEQWNVLMTLQEELDFWEGPAKNRPFRVMVNPTTIPSFERILGEFGILSDVIIDNVEE